MREAIRLDALALGAAGTRLAPERGLALDPRRWAWQPKIDGALVRVSTDRAGRIASLLHRSGEPVRAEDADGLIGLATGLPDAILVGELECHTEAGIRARDTRGWAQLHVFDAARVLGRSIAREAYHVRYGWLHRWQSDVECYGEVARTDWWSVDDQGDAHDPTTGRYVRPVPRDLRRLPIVPLARGKGAGAQLWSEFVERDGGEGLVAVRLDAPLGARGSKRKIKMTDSIDAVVVRVEGKRALLSWAGRTFVASTTKHRLAPGVIVEVSCDGYYESSSVPRFARIARVRRDLGGTPETRNAS